MKILFDSRPKNTLNVNGTDYRGGEVFEVDDDTGERLIANPATHCRLPGDRPKPSRPKKPSGHRRIPQATAPHADVGDAENPVVVADDAGEDVTPEPRAKGKRAKADEPTPDVPAPDDARAATD